MKLSAFVAIAAVIGGSFLVPVPVEATEVAPKVHKLCIEAKDYAGCVKAMKGDTSPETVRTINSQGADIAEGNKCPAGMAYIGGGNCQMVRCFYPATDLGHDQLIAGKKDRSGKDVWGCKYNWLRGAGEMRIVGVATRTSNDTNCPSGEPKLGFNSTCQTAAKDWLSPAATAIEIEREGPKCDFKLKAYDCSYSKYLVANPAMKEWAELNPEMASKERLRLQSVD